jgi:hypothetical protein
MWSPSAIAVGCRGGRIAYDLCAARSRQADAVARPGVVVASYGVMSSGAAEFVVDLNLGPRDVAYAMQIMGVRRVIAERNEARRVATLGLDVMILEDILARPLPPSLRRRSIRAPGARRS